MLYNDGIRDNTAEIQNMLDECGIQRIEKPGKYLISKTLIIKSNTRLVLSPGAQIIVAPMSKCALIENEHFAGGGHDENIEIIGGIWDGNCDAMGLDGTWEAKHRCDNPYSPSRFMGKLMRFAHINNITLEKLTVKNPVSYGIQIGGVCRFTVRDIHFDYNCHFGTTDGVHINGPARCGLIENISGTTNDDMVSLTTCDEEHAEITYGDISEVEIKNICAYNGYSGVRLLSCGGYTVKNILINGVYGDYRHNAVLITNHRLRAGSYCFFDDITVEHIHAHKTEKPLGNDCFTFWENNAIETLSVVWVGFDINIGRLNLRDISRHETSKLTTAPLLLIDNEVTIDRLYLDNITQTLDEGIEAPLIVCEAKIGKMICHDVE